jgi:hypothetical protein
LRQVHVAKYFSLGFPGLVVIITGALVFDDYSTEARSVTVINIKDYDKSNKQYISIHSLMNTCLDTKPSSMFNNGIESFRTHALFHVVSLIFRAQ